MYDIFRIGIRNGLSNLPWWGFLGNSYVPKYDTSRKWIYLSKCPNTDGLTNVYLLQVRCYRRSIIKATRNPPRFFYTVLVVCRYLPTYLNCKSLVQYWQGAYSKIERPIVDWWQWTYGYIGANKTRGRLSGPLRYAALFKLTQTFPLFRHGDKRFLKCFNCLVIIRLPFSIAKIRIKWTACLKSIIKSERQVPMYMYVKAHNKYLFI